MIQNNNVDCNRLTISKIRKIFLNLEIYKQMCIIDMSWKKNAFNFSLNFY